MPYYHFHLDPQDGDEVVFDLGDQYPSEADGVAALKRWAQDAVDLGDIEPGTYTWMLEEVIDDGADLEFVRTGTITLV